MERAERMEKVAAILQKISELPQDRRKQHYKDLAESLTLDELISLQVVMSGTPLNEEAAFRVEMMCSLYECLGVSMDSSVSNLPTEITGKMEKARGLYAEYAELIKKIYHVWNENLEGEHATTRQDI